MAASWLLRKWKQINSGSDMEEVVTAVVIGAGCRGENYATFALDFPARLKIVGVAEPRVFRREEMKQAHGIPTDKVFNNWSELVKVKKFADVAIVTTQDQLHKDPAVACANKGYHILLEKPMAVTEEDCREIVTTCEKNNVILAVCHVLRYYPPVRKIKELINSGAIGDVVNIQHTEPVGYWHFAHSYVRGNWRNEESSSFSLMAKSCHDVDLLRYWMGDARCTHVSSFGSLQHFRKEKKPTGASSRCMDCPVEADCPYSAKKLYLEQLKWGNTGWPVSVICDVPDIENVTDALKNGPYGRCVYECDNDVCDNQVVNFNFEGGRTATLTMIAFTEAVCTRKTTVYGTKGEIRCDDSSVFLYEFNTGKLTQCKSEKRPTGSRLAGHGYADYYLMDAFLNAILTKDVSGIKTGPRDTLASHILVFAAEKARKENRVITINEDYSYQ